LALVPGSLRVIFIFFLKIRYLTICQTKNHGATLAPTEQSRDKKQACNSIPMIRHRGWQGLAGSIESTPYPMARRNRYRGHPSAGIHGYMVATVKR
jgi:hypothetical protein